MYVCATKVQKSLTRTKGLTTKVHSPYPMKDGQTYVTVNENTKASRKEGLMDAFWTSDLCSIKHHRIKYNGGQCLAM